MTIVELKAGVRRAAIEDHVHLAAKIGFDVLRPRWAHAPGLVGARSSDWDGRRSEEIACGRVGRNADRYCFEACGDEFADAMGGMLRQRQNEGQRPGPEMAGQRERFFVKLGKAEGRFEIRDMHDQWIEARAALRLKNARHGLALCGVRAEPIHRLGRERDNTASADNPRGLRNRRLVRLNDHVRSPQRRQTIGLRIAALEELRPR